MYTKIIFSSLAALLLSFSPLVAAKENNFQSGNYIQTIQVINLLANTNLSDVGMTPTPIIVKYFNGRQNPCWINTIDFQGDAGIHVGPTQGCQQKVDEVTITPVIIANRLKTYEGVTIKIDITRFANQITITQDTAPVFDRESGLVVTPGTIKVNLQSNYFA